MLCISAFVGTSILFFDKSSVNKRNAKFAGWNKLFVKQAENRNARENMTFIKLMYVITYRESMIGRILMVMAMIYVARQRLHVASRESPIFRTCLQQVFQSSTYWRHKFLVQWNHVERKIPL